jgi:hypothetical protein
MAPDSTERTSPIALKDGANLHPPLFPTGQLAAAAYGPEPQGTPVIHGQLEPLVGAGPRARIPRPAPGPPWRWRGYR